MPAGLCGLGRPCGRQDFNPERWIAPAGFSSTNISEYQEYVLQIAMRQRGWEGRTPFPCWRPIDCPPSLLARVIARQDAADGSEESCSAHLQRHKCYDMPLPLVHPVELRMERVKKLVRFACPRLVPRDSCACLGCFTVCRPSALCPAPGGAAVEPPPAPASGSFAYAIVLAAAADDGRQSPAWEERYLHGAFRVALTLRHVGSAFQTVLLQQNMSADALVPFTRLGVRVLPLPPLEPPAASARRDVRMAKTFVKLHLFSLTQFERVVALDVDIIVRRNIDHLFSAAVRAPAAVLDSHWADRGVMQGRAGGHTTARGGPPVFPFNSGLLVLTPSARLHARMLATVNELPSYDAGDQGFLASFFGREVGPWHELPRRYALNYQNMMADELDSALTWHAMHGTSDGAFRQQCDLVPLCLKSAPASWCNGRNLGYHPRTCPPTAWWRRHAAARRPRYTSTRYK